MTGRSNHRRYIVRFRKCHKRWSNRALVLVVGRGSRLKNGRSTLHTKMSVLGKIYRPNRSSSEFYGCRNLHTCWCLLVAHPSPFIVVALGPPNDNINLYNTESTPLQPNETRLYNPARYIHSRTTFSSGYGSDTTSLRPSYASIKVLQRTPQSQQIWKSTRSNPSTTTEHIRDRQLQTGKRSHHHQEPENTTSLRPKTLEEAGTEPTTFRDEIHKTRLTTTSTTNRFRRRTKDECFTRFARLHEPDRAVKRRRIDLSPQDRKPLVGLRESLLHHHFFRSGAHTPTSKWSSNGGPLLHHTTRRPRILQKNRTQGQAQRRQWTLAEHKSSFLLRGERKGSDILLKPAFVSSSILNLKINFVDEIYDFLNMVVVEGNSNVLELSSGPLPSNQVLHPFLTDNILGLYA
ncbi:hypothetical protein YC2023_055184 [Brassica napus]